MSPLTITATCLTGCGLLGEGLSTDQPERKRPTNWKGTDGSWTRWDELDRLAEKHPHATLVAVKPTLRPA